MDKFYLELPEAERTQNVVIDVNAQRNPPVLANVPRTVSFCTDGYNYFSLYGLNDLALNILQSFLPGRDIPLNEGTRASVAAFALLARFREAFLEKRLFVKSLEAQPKEPYRLVLEVRAVKDWIRQTLPHMPEQFRRRHVAVLEGELTQDMVDQEDGGAVLRVPLVKPLGGAPVTFGAASGVGLLFASAEEGMPYVHHDLKALLGKRYRITIEEVIYAYNG